MSHETAAASTAQRPCLLFYCQHSLGIGHLTRSFALARALAPHFRVVFLNGGRLPPELPVPPDMERIDLPALGMDDGHTVVSRDAGRSLQEAVLLRHGLICDAVARHRPALVLVELFPFGRKKFAGEILAMIRAARRQAGGTQVVCSLRDILVDVRPDQQQHDDRARWLVDRYFDAVLVHADPALARLEDSFAPRRALRTPVHYTGYVAPERSLPLGSSTPKREAHALVSAGGGIVGLPLFEAVLDARALLPQPPPLRIVAGPFLPEAHWQRLQQRVAGLPDVELLRQVPDMVAQMRQARMSISQCGYNTALDILAAGVPALVCPYATPTENEQAERAERLAARGLLQALASSQTSPQPLARALQDLPQFVPKANGLALQGAQQTAQLLCSLMGPKTEVTA